MNYTEQQISAAKENAELHGYATVQVSDELAIEFLDWYFNHETEYSTELEAIVAGLSGLVTNGIEQQQVFWEVRLGQINQSDC